MEVATKANPPSGVKEAMACKTQDIDVDDLSEEGDEVGDDGEEEDLGETREETSLVTHEEAAVALGTVLLDDLGGGGEEHGHGADAGEPHEQVDACAAETGGRERLDEVGGDAEVSVGVAHAAVDDGGGDGEEQVDETDGEDGLLGGGERARLLRAVDLLLRVREGRGGDVVGEEAEVVAQREGRGAEVGEEAHRAAAEEQRRVELDVDGAEAVAAGERRRTTYMITTRYESTSVKMPNHDTK